MRRILTYLGVILLLVAVVGCNMNNNSSSPTPHFFVAGSAYSKNEAGYSEDGGAFTSVATGTLAGSLVGGSGSNIVVQGLDYNTQSHYYWQKGTTTTLTLPGGDTWGFTNGIAVSGNTVYISGMVHPASGPNLPCLWVNGSPILLPVTGGTSGNTNGVVAGTGGIYILGGVNGSPGFPAYWDGNGTLHHLPEPSGYAGGWTNGAGSTPNSMTVVSNGDVYMAGTSYLTTGSGNSAEIVWKNGQILWYVAADPTTNYAVTCLAVGGSDVYALGVTDSGSGSASAPYVWKNGALAGPLSTTGLGGNKNTPIYAAIPGNNSYVIGKPVYYSNTDPLTPIIWVNSNNPTALSWSALNTDPNATVQGIQLVGSDIWFTATTGTSNGSGGINYADATHAVAWKNGSIMTLPMDDAYGTSVVAQ